MTLPPGYATLVDLAAKTLPANANVLDVGGPAVPHPRLSGRRVTPIAGEEALAFLAAYEADPFDAILAFSPTRHGALIPLLQAMHGAMRPEGVAIVSDLVWQTAPTPDLMRAFAPPPGREKVRPIEGFEMQLDHAGFAIIERVDIPRDAWVEALSREQRAAVGSDTRGAAKLAAWIVRRAPE